MNDARDRVINYLSSLSYEERQKILDEVRKHDAIESRDNSERNRKSYLKQVDKNRKMGDLMRITVIPGDIVKCRGTNDRQGIREVLECTEYGIKARKIERRVKYIRGPAMLTPEITHERAGYITEHSWDKVAKIFGKDEITLTGA